MQDVNINNKQTNKHKQQQEKNNWHSQNNTTAISVKSCRRVKVAAYIFLYATLLVDFGVGRNRRGMLAAHV